MRTIIINVLLFLLVSNNILAQQSQYRGMVINNKTEGREAKVESNTYALVIGTDIYNDYPNLYNPIKDAKGVGEVLDKGYGFKVTYLENPSSNQVLSTLRTYHNKLKKDDRFLLYVAGHGDYDSVYFNQAYLILRHSKKTDMNRLTHLPFHTVSKMSEKLPAQQVLIIADVCYGGAFNNQLLRKVSSGYSTHHVSASKFLEDQLKHKNRCVLSSGRLTPVADGRPGEHSPFAKMLIHTLENHQEDSIVTASDIKNELATLSSKPTLGYFGDNLSVSEFVFKSESKKASSEELLALAKDEYQSVLMNLTENQWSTGIAPKKKLQHILSLLQESSQLGHPEASFWIALIEKKYQVNHLSDNQIELYAKQAVDLFKTEIQNGDNIHEGMLAILQSENIYRHSSDEDVKKWFKSSMASEDPLSFYYAGKYCLKHRQLKRAYQFYKEGAGNDDALCQFELAKLKYTRKNDLFALGLETDDYIDWLKKASNNGLRIANEVLISIGQIE
ncbi:caspase family protein [Flammeovirga agarivorans]|uniref:Peptidase C14 caspase domain-containing protein n=1 Tax=Flammeovirga agarivorans TaxID=2726742 RepID=A0A7X8SLX5_9BACT|nr:caspase family protein [Flammeovirga agarivorans]NLR92649.1 hypothetical protein [Flammeovirga agarivorans]